MSFLSQAPPLGGLSPPHGAFQEHAAHIAEWSAMLSSKGSVGTCIPKGVSTFLPAAFTAHDVGVPEAAEIPGNWRALPGADRRVRLPDQVLDQAGDIDFPRAGERKERQQFVGGELPEVLALVGNPLCSEDLRCRRCDGHARAPLPPAAPRRGGWHALPSRRGRGPCPSSPPASPPPAIAAHRFSRRAHPP
jgi:hypothetical protein